MKVKRLSMLCPYSYETQQNMIRKMNELVGEVNEINEFLTMWKKGMKKVLFKKGGEQND